MIPTILKEPPHTARQITLPPISVASAVELEVHIPVYSSSRYYFLHSDAFCFCFRFGTQSRFLFGPAMVVWFSMLLVWNFLIIIHPILEL